MFNHKTIFANQAQKLIMPFEHVSLDLTRKKKKITIKGKKANMLTAYPCKI